MPERVRRTEASQPATSQRVDSPHKCLSDTNFPKSSGSRVGIRRIGPHPLVQCSVMSGRLVSINSNATKEFRKLPQAEGHLITDFGLEGDRHAGRPLRQVSILNVETVTELKQA